MRSRERKKKKFLRWFLLLAFLFALLFAGLAFLSRISQLHIANFDISGTSPADDSAIRSLVSEAASGYYLYFFPKSDILLYPAGKVRAEILNQFPEISSADVGRSDLKTVTVSLIQKKPVATWCGNSPTNPQPCLFLDESGEAYKLAPQFSVSPYFQYFGTLSTSTLPAAFLPKEGFASLENLISSLSGIFSATTAYLTPDGDFELSDAAKTVVKIGEKDNYSLALRYLKAFLSNPSFGNPDKFEYIDLRFGKKVYYKLRQ